MLHVTKLNHATLLVTKGKTKILVDPGELGPWPMLDGLDAILTTHQHFDHFDPVVVRSALAQKIPVWAPSDVVEKLKKNKNLHTANVGDTFKVEDVHVTVGGGLHAPMHPEATPPLNRAYVLDDALFITGDALAEAPAPFTAVAAPINAPWLKLTDLIKYVRVLKPAVFVGVHDGLLNADGLKVAHRGAKSLESEGAGEVLLPSEGTVLEIYGVAESGSAAEPTSVTHNGSSSDASSSSSSGSGTDPSTDAGEGDSTDTSADAQGS